MLPKINNEAIFTSYSDYEKTLKYHHKRVESFEKNIDKIKISKFNDPDPNMLANTVGKLN